ncbi:hypothetical protein BKA62DRAFT_497140 [Auriculariales sp. MPI-PUGE-AT-0066]|nr:hypothetical protein BKA62DRAFT_497140 [Auriculariales sp. MPI-PUGE-AT-0066]
MSVLQSHLYNQFLTGSAADVALHVQGSWEAVYNLHRVVLIQADFFSALFVGGFSESRVLGRRSKLAEPQTIRIQFDDPNITRPAFEICLSRLYGGGPELYISPSLQSTPGSPLTAAFTSKAVRGVAPSGSHNATPRFLLSLLATSAYLNIPSITTHILEIITSSISPYTAIRYLRFASGHGIGEVEPGEAEHAAGLQHVGKLPGTAAFDDSLSIASSAASSACASEDDDECNQKETIRSSAASSIVEEASFNYGRISEQVGEVAMCFLARWGQEILAAEEEAAEHVDSLDQALLPQTPRIWARGGLKATWVRGLLSSDDFFVRSERERYDMARRVVELRRRGGITADEEEEWATLFREGIYYTSIPYEDMVTMSRDVSPTTNAPYVPLAVLHAAHWAQSQLRAHVMARPGSLMLGQQLPSPGGTPPRERDLGLTQTTQQISVRQAAEHLPHEEPAFFYPVFADGSDRIGSPAANENGRETSNQNQYMPRTGFSRDFFGLRYSKHSPAAALATDINISKPSTRWSTYAPFRFSVEFWNVRELDQKVFSHTIWYGGSLFNVYAQLVRKKGIQLGVYLHRQSSVEAIPRPTSPPNSMRNAAPPAMLRSISNGSIASPRPQPWTNNSPSSNHQNRPSLGNSSTPAFSAGGSGARHRASSSVPGVSTNVTPRAITPQSTSPTSRSPQYSSSGLPIVSSSPPLERTSSSLGSPRLSFPLLSANPPAPLQPYRDPRSAVTVYFGISCFVHPAAVIRFTSSPDAFTPSQSWGWSSNKLIAPVGGEGDDTRPTSLRATITIGLV